MKRAFGIFTVLLLTACASTKQYAPIATTETLKEGNALIHVERKNEFMGGGRSIEVTENNIVVGELSPGKSLTWECPAGSVAINLAPAIFAVSNSPPVNITAVAGQVYSFIASWSGDKNSFIVEQK